MVQENIDKVGSRTQIVLRKYRTRNFLLAGALVSGIVGVYYYTISKVKQEDFSEYDSLPRQTQK